ncbi:MAG: response regulator transcription factor [Lachnospiraceae bacterium]|nr:response regulator transcription factor [Lachnospiraceae bacterium]
MDKVLVCDDDKEIVDAIDIYLSREGIEVYKAYNGKEALEILENEDIQLVLMDIMMPIMDGIEATKIIREKSTLPIILLSAKSEESDKINGLDIGADDYITKPFNAGELVARVKSNLRRYTSLGGQKDENASIIKIGGLTINDENKQIFVDGEFVRLTPIEYNILLFLAKNKGNVFSSPQIYEHIWNEKPIDAENTVAVHIRHIREKIEINPREPQYLKVVWGVGYKIEGDL